MAILPIWSRRRDPRARVVGDQHLASRREGLHTSGEVHSRPDRGVLRATQRPDVHDDHTAGVHTDAHFELHIILRRQPPVDVCHGELHAEGAGDRLRRVVVTGNRGTKDDEDRVADNLVDGAIVPADDVHHRVEVEIEDLDHRARWHPLGHGGEPAKV